jgi:hypothetical protein
MMFEWCAYCFFLGCVCVCLGFLGGFIYTHIYMCVYVCLV